MVTLEEALHHVNLSDTVATDFCRLLAQMPMTLDCVQVQDGYPIDQVLPQGNPLCVAWDPDARIPRKNSSDIYVGSTTSLGGRDFQMKFGYVVVGVFKGDFITVGLLGALHICACVGDCHALPFWCCVVGLTVHAPVLWNLERVGLKYVGFLVRSAGQAEATTEVSPCTLRYAYCACPTILMSLSLMPCWPTTMMPRCA